MASPGESRQEKREMSQRDRAKFYSKVMAIKENINQFLQLICLFLEVWCEHSKYTRRHAHFISSYGGRVYGVTIIECQSHVTHC